MEGNPAEQTDKSAAVDITVNLLSLYHRALCPGNYIGQAQFVYSSP